MLGGQIKTMGKQYPLVETIFAIHGMSLLELLVGKKIFLKIF